MALFDALIDDLANRLGLGGAAAPLAREALALVIGADGGIAGFIGLFKRTGLGAIAESWLGQANAASLSTADLEAALGAPAIDAIAHRAGIALPPTTAALGYALPKIVGLLTPQGVVPAALPAEASALLAVSGDDHGHASDVKQIRASAVAPYWLWPVVGVATVLGLGWAVWPILFPNNPPAASAIQSAAPAQAPAVAEAPKPARAPAAETAAPAPAATPAPSRSVADAPKAKPAPAAEAAAPAPAVAPVPAATVAEAPRPAPSVPSTLSVADDNGVADVSGAVHDDQIRGSILAALKAVFGADNVKGDITVDASRADAPWLANLRAALNALKIPGLKAAFEGGAIKLGGAIPDADRERIAASLGSIFGSGATVSTVAPSLGDWGTTAYAGAAAALGALKTGASPADVVAALNLSVVHFDTDSAEVPTLARAFLENAAASLKALPAGSEIEIAGYANDTGDAEANLAVSQHRGDAVRDALVKAGVPADLLVAKGYGGENPIADNDTEAGRLRNRRIEFHVLKTPPATPVTAAAEPAPARAPAPAPAAAATTNAAAPSPVAAPAATVLEAPQPAPTVPSTLSVADDNGVADVSGAVHDDQTRDSILDALKAVFGADNVKGDITVEATRADAPWASKLAAALHALRAPGLKATFDGAAIKLGGAIPDAERERMAASLGSIYGSGATVSTIAPSLGDWAGTAYTGAAAALDALKTGASAVDVVAALNLSVVHFDTDSAEVSTLTRAFLETAAASLKALPAGSEIEIAGYANDTGDAETNLAVSQHRADAVRDTLVKAGVPADRLIAKGYGGANPIADNDTEEGRVRNRRIEFHVLNAPVAAPIAAAAESAPAPAPAAAATTDAAAPAPTAIVAEAQKPPPTGPSMLSITDDSGVADVSGAVPDDKTRGSILDALKAVFGADNVKGDIAVDAGRADAPWLANLSAALDALKIPGLKATFDGAAIKLGGAIQGADRDKIAASLSSIFGDGVTFGSLVPSLGELETAANAKAAAALGSLKAGYNGDQVVNALNLSVVNFATSSAEVPDSVSGLLKDAAATLKALPTGTVIEIGGYTDSTGDPDANLVLSQQRAESVRGTLIKDGAPEDMLTAKGYGAADPIDSNDTEEGRFHNRRIEYHVTKTP